MLVTQTRGHKVTGGAQEPGVEGVAGRMGALREDGGSQEGAAAVTRAGDCVPGLSSLHLEKSEQGL